MTIRDRIAKLVQVTAAAAILWKYVDEDGKDFYLAEKKTGTVRSPYSGKSFTAKPERSSLGDVSKEQKEDGSKTKGSLFKYTDDEGNDFYLPEKKTSTLKSPYSGKSVTPKAEKSTLSDVGKDLKEKIASSPMQWELASDILAKKESHPALKVLQVQYAKILEGLEEAAQRSARMKKVGVGTTEDPTFILAHVVPEIRKLGEKCLLVAKQLEEKLD